MITDKIKYGKQITIAKASETCIEDHEIEVQSALCHFMLC
jgi:hypothetical protein